MQVTAFGIDEERIVVDVTGAGIHVGVIRIIILDTTVFHGNHILDDVKRYVGDRPQSDDMCLACFGRD